jgi:hypothetical protein
MVSPLRAWSLVIVAVVSTVMIWVVSAPIVTAFYGAANGLLSEEAEGPATTLRLEFIMLPIVICIGLVIWAFLVTTRRQLVTAPGGYF